MIQEAKLQLSLLREDGAILSLCQKDVKVSDAFDITVDIKMMSKTEGLEDQRLLFDDVNLKIENAEVQPSKTAEKTAEKTTEMTDSSTQHEDSEMQTPNSDNQDSKSGVQNSKEDSKESKESKDDETQTVGNIDAESIGVQTEEKRDDVEEKKGLIPLAKTESQSVEVQTDNAETASNAQASPASEVAAENSALVIKPTTEMSTQTDQPLIKDLLESIEFQVENEASTSDSPPVGRKLRKRLFQPPSSSDESENETDFVGEDFASDDEEEGEVRFVGVKKQWNRDLQSVIESLNDSDSKGKAAKAVKPNNSAKNNTKKKSKRKPGRPRKVPQVIKEESSDEEEEGEVKKESPDGAENDSPTAPKKSRVYQCSGCGEIFQKKSLLMTHKADCVMAPGAQVTPHEKTGFYQCPSCDKTYTKMSHMRRHQKCHSDIREHVCQFCPKAFFRKEHKDKHEQTHVTLKCQYCDEVVTGKSNLLRHEKTHLPADPSPKKPPAKKTTPCRYCGKLFGGRAQCEQHEITHTNEKPYKCSYCDLHFSKRGNALKHERRIHLMLKPHMCQYCGKTFAQKPDCKKHEMRHLGEKRVKCNYCDKMFLENHHRIVHERTHTGDRPYKCVVCNHAFSQSYDCKKHMRIHLKDKGAKGVNSVRGTDGTVDGRNVADIVANIAGSLAGTSLLSGTGLTATGSGVSGNSMLAQSLAGTSGSGSNQLSQEMEGQKAAEYLQLQVRHAKAAVMGNNSQPQQQHLVAAHQSQSQQPEQGQSQQSQNNVPQQQAQQGAAPTHHILEGGQMYPIYDYQTITTQALNPEYMMQAVAASSSIHQMGPQGPTAVFAPHHEMPATVAAGPFMQNPFDIRKMQQIMNTQNNSADN